jgi:hypothetical protein
LYTCGGLFSGFRHLVPLLSGLKKQEGSNTVGLGKENIGSAIDLLCARTLIVCTKKHLVLALFLLLVKFKAYYSRLIIQHFKIQQQIMDIYNSEIYYITDVNWLLSNTMLIFPPLHLNFKSHIIIATWPCPVSLMWMKIGSNDIAVQCQESLNNYFPLWGVIWVPRKWVPTRENNFFTLSLH